MNEASQRINRIEIEGIGSRGDEAHGLGKLAVMRSEPKFWRFFLYGVGLVSVCAFMRLRFTWWPFHPLVLLLFNEWCLSRLYLSFFLAWIIKLLIIRIGGGRVFAGSKPFFIGVIVGQIVICGVWTVVGSLYFLFTGSAPPVIAFFR